MNAQSNVQDKSGEPRRSVAVMEGKGFYNKNAAIPAAGGALAIPLFEQAAKVIDLDAAGRSIVQAWRMSGCSPSAVISKVDPVLG